MITKVRTSLFAVAALGAMGTGASACSNDSGGGKVNVTESEWIVEPDPTTESAGDIEFVGDNKGSETHEMVVVRADNADALPTDADGAVDEERLSKDARIGEIEDIAAQSSKTVTLNLKDGQYVVFCNVTETLDSGEIQSHFAKGMHANFAVG